MKTEQKQQQQKPLFYFIMALLLTVLYIICSDTESWFNSQIERDISAETLTPLTLEKLRTYEGFENVSDEKGKEDIYFIESFANILYSLYQQENKC